MTNSGLPHGALTLALLLGGVGLAVPVLAASPAAVQANLAAEPALMLAKDWHVGLNPAHYWVSEKFDGVRAFWDGRVLRFKSGRSIAAPAWFTAGLPATPLDGELWLGHRSFDRLSGVVRKLEPVDAEWREVRYLVFDTPAATGDFATRASQIATLVARAKLPWLIAVQQTRVADRKALQLMLQATAKAGGEGLVLHQADAVWESGRSDAVRKLKMQPDEEARVVGHVAGKGRHKGSLGALLMETPQGQRFALGSGFTDAQRAEPPPIGATVSYHYRGRTSTGLPRFTSFLRVREVE
ncbi:MAG: DNA ligase [Rhodoferax sp.]|nr:DNA ligase [Rhodoferax sp.]